MGASFFNTVTYEDHLRHLEKSVANDIETMSFTNPNEFRNKIRKLGLWNKSIIPKGVLKEGGILLTTERDVLQRWRTDFENLYNSNFNHFNFVKSVKHTREHHMESHMFEYNVELNCYITDIHVVMRSKSSSVAASTEIHTTS